MSTSFASQIDYKHVEPSANPKYRFMRIPLNNITVSSFQVGPTTPQLMEFKLPNTVYNLAQSYVSYQLALPAAGGTLVNWVNEDCFDLATNAYFGSAGGMDLCNLNFVNRYTKVVRKMKTSFTDFMSKDNTAQLYPCNTVAGNGNPTVANPIAATGGGSITNYTEPRYILAGPSNGTSTHTRLFNLRGIRDTIFSVDKDLYIPTDMYVRFTAGVGNQMVFTSAQNTDPVNGQAAITQNITIQNTFLYLAVETNQLIVDSVMAKVLSSGLKLTVPYTTAFRNSSTGTIANIQIPITQQYGRKLKRMIHTVWNATESSYTALDCTNVAGSKIALYNTFMDNKQLQDMQLSTAVPSTTAMNADDWRENQKYCKGSVIQNKAMYQNNWFHCDSWVDPSTHYFDDDSNEDDGLPMEAPRLWQMQAVTANGTWTHYDFATFVRHVIIDRSGPNFA